MIFTAPGRTIVTASTECYACGALRADHVGQRRRCPDWEDTGSRCRKCGLGVRDHYSTGHLYDDSVKPLDGDSYDDARAYDEEGGEA